MASVALLFGKATSYAGKIPFNHYCFVCVMWLIFSAHEKVLFHFKYFVLLYVELFINLHGT